MKKKILSVALAVSVLFSSWGSVYAADFQSSEDLAVFTEEEQPDAAVETLSEETEDFSDEAEISVEEPTEKTDSSDEAEPEIAFDDEESDEIEITEEDESAEDEIQLEESTEEEEVTDFDDGESEVSTQAGIIDTAKALYQSKLPDGTYSVDGFMESGGAKGTVTIENDTDIIYTKISASAFEGVNLTKVILPDTITEIGDKAFYNCSNLTSVNTPANLKIIGKEAFSGCNRLEDFDFTEAVEVIKDKAFYNSEWNIELPESVRKVGSKAFAIESKSPAARNLTICGNIANLAEDAFDGRKVSYLQLGKDVEDLPEYLMPGSRNQEVYSELKGVRIDKENSVWSSEDNVWYGAWFDKDKTTLLKYPCKRSYVGKYEIPSTVTKIGPYAFRDSQINEVVIPDSVMSVGTGAFYGCKATSINIPDWMTSIPDYAFAANLKSVKIPESVVKIGEGAFAGGAYTSLTIPESVVEIGAKAFGTSSENRYTSLNIPDSVEKIGEDAFGSRQKDCTITIGSGLKDITNLPEAQAYIVSEENPRFSSEDGVLFNKDKTILKKYPKYKTDTSYKVPDCVTVLEGTLGNSNLESVVIGDGVKSIPGVCFSYSESIKSVTLGKSVEKVGEMAFLDMPALETLVINSDLTDEQLNESCIAANKGTNIKIGNATLIASLFFNSSNIASIEPDKEADAVVKVNGVFYSKDMTRLIKYDPTLTKSTFTIPDTVRYISPYAFYECKHLNNLVINSNIEEVGEEAFTGTHISYLYVDKNVTQIPGAITDNINVNDGIKIVDGNDTLVWEDGVLFTSDMKTLVKYPSFFANSSLTNKEYVVPDTVTTIRKEAFNNEFLRKITLPAGITEIPEHAFYECDALETVIAQGKIHSIGDYAFKDCPKYKGDIDLSEADYIGKYAFTDCSEISGTLKIQNAEEIGAHAFENCTGITALELTNVKRIGAGAFAGCTGVTSIILNNVGTIEKDAFAEIAPKILHLGNSEMPEELKDKTENLTDFKADKENTSVSDSSGVLFSDNGKTLIKYMDTTGQTSYTVPATVERIGASAFRNQKTLKKVVLPNSVKEIGAYAFYGCSGLTDINIPEGLQKIGAYAFYQCKGVKGKVTLPEILTIGEYAFYECSGITEIEIGKEGDSAAGRKIGDYSFAKCSNVGSIIFHGDAPDKMHRTAFDAIAGIFKYDPAGKGWSELLGELAYGTIRVLENTYCERAVALVVDCSGSMEGEPASALGTAIRTFCSGILDGSNDTQIMVIKYSDTASTYGFTSNLDGILNYSATYANGGTNTAAAIARAGACLDGIDAAEKDILIMSDGMPNSEDDAVAEFKKLNPEYRVFSMGFFHSLSGSDLASARSFMKKIQNMGYYEVSDISALNYAFKNTASTVKSPLKVTVTDSMKTVQNTGEAYVEVTVKGVMTNKSKNIINNIKGSLKVSDDTADLVQNRQMVKSLVPNQSAVATWTVKVPILPKEQKYDYSVTVKADNMDTTEFFGRLTIPAIDGNSITLEKDLMVNPEETVTVHAGIIATDYTPDKTKLTWSVQGQDSGTVKISNTTVTKISDYTYSASADITAAKEGTYAVTLKADNGTSDTTTLEVKDLFDIANCNITVPECTYNGKAQTPNPTVTRKDGANDLILANAQDYTVIYEDNKNVGKGTAVVTGAGKYHGTQSVKFNIVPSTVRNLRGDNELSTETEAYAGAVRNMELAWDVPTENSLDGYVIWYGKDEKFKDYTEEILDKTEPKYSGDSLERATTYYAKVRAYKEVDGEKLLGEWSKVLTVKTGRQILVSEMWGFDNLTMLVKMEYFYRLFKNDPAAAERISKNFGGVINGLGSVKLAGICYGMVTVATAMMDELFPEDAYGISDLNDIKSFDQASEYKSSELNMTAKDALIFAQIAQMFQLNFNIEQRNRNNLDGLYQAVKECQKGNGQPVALGLMANVKNKHRILAVGITEDTENQVKIAVYDPNCHNNDRKEMYLFRQNGRFTGYSYEDFPYTWAGQLDTIDSDKDYLSFDTKSQWALSVQLKTVDTVSDESAFPDQALVSATVKEKWEAWINRQIYGAPIDFENAVEESKQLSKLWRADKNQTFTFEEVPEGSEISVTTSNHSVTVTTTKQSNLSINVDETNANDISITSSEDGSFIVTFKDYTSLSEPAKETTVTVDCKAGITTTVKQTEDSRIRLKGAESASYNRQEGVCDTETGLLKDASKEELKTPSLDSSKSYEISSDDSDVKLSASSKNDDVYDEVIKTTSAEDHSWDNGTVTKEPTCVVAGEKTYSCEICKETKTETIPATGNHAWGEWTVVSKATTQAPEQQQRVCPICKKKETRSVGEKLQKPQTGNSSIPFTLNASSLKLKTKQKTTAFKVISMPTGAYVSSVKSSNTKILKVMKFTKTGAITLKAQNKTGRAKLIITLSNGQSKQTTVKVQKGAVRTTKIIGITKKITLKKGKKVKLKPAILPITSVEKITYKSSNSKVASVDSKGNIKARKKGKATITVKSGKKTVKCTITVK